MKKGSGQKRSGVPKSKVKILRRELKLDEFKPTSSMRRKLR